jgi:hypothetical protein
MALSPNYGWAEPDNSSLVKNGAQDIRALGDAIDTSVWNVGYGQAGKNKIINGDFRIWQRGTTLSGGGYLADRFNCTTDATITQSRETFTPGTAPVAGYEAQYFIRYTKSAGGSFMSPVQYIEDVRTFAGQTITLSFWAKADAAVSIQPYYIQSFGSGGSSANQAIIATQAITTSWARYSFTVTLPSIAGKTIGTSSYLQLFTGRYVGSAATTIDIWGVQAEAGSKATPFQTATGTIQGELAACQRYYYRITTDAATRQFGTGLAYSTTQALISFQFPVTMRTRPTALEQSGTAADYATLRNNTGLDNLTGVPVFYSVSSNIQASILTASTNLVQGDITMINFNNTNAYLGWSAEL